MATAVKAPSAIRISVTAGPKEKYPFLALIIRAGSAINAHGGRGLKECEETAMKYEALRQAHIASGALGIQSDAMKELKDTFAKECGCPARDGKLVKNVPGSDNVKEAAWNSFSQAFFLAHNMVKAGINTQIEDWNKETFATVRRRLAVHRRANRPEADPKSAKTAPEGSGSGQKVVDAESNVDAVLDGMLQLLPQVRMKGGKLWFPGKYDQTNADAFAERAGLILDQYTALRASKQQSTKRPLLDLAGKDSAKTLALPRASGE